MLPPRPMLDGDYDCSRSSYLDQEEKFNREMEEARICHMMRTKPGFEVLMNMRGKVGRE